MLTSTRLRGGALLGVIALAGGLALPTGAYAAEAPVVKDDPVRLDKGHIDAFTLVLNEDDSIRLVLKEDATGSHVLRKPETVTLAVNSQAISTNLPAASVPEAAPTELYHLPISQDQQLIWPGWDSQSIMSVYGSDAKVDIKISDVDGPGDVFLWSNNAFGAPVQLLTGTWKFPGTIHQDYLAHVHANWGFTEPGTYKLTAQAEVASADGNKNSTSNTAKYTFVVAPVPTALAVSGAEDKVNTGSEVTLTAAQSPADATFSEHAWQTRASANAEWATVDGAKASTLKVNAVDGAQYRATVSGGQDFAIAGDPQPIVVASDPVTISTIDETPVEQKISIKPLADHYHSNSPIDLEVVADPAVDSATYRWYLQRTDQDKPVLIEGATGSTHRFAAAEQALNGAKVTAELVASDNSVSATASAVTIKVDDHDAAPLQKVTIGGIADHYHTGDTAKLTASVEPASVLSRFEWYVQKKGETTPVLVEGENDATYSFPVVEDLADAAVIAKLTYDNGNSYVESAPVILKLDDHEAPQTELTITTNRDADDYWVGQTATLTANQSVATGLTEYQWLVKLPGADDFVADDDQAAAEYRFKPTLANSGVQVKARLLHDGEVHAESAPVTITAQQRDSVTTLTVTADKASYVAGETAQLKSTQNPLTDESHYHWYVKRAGASDFTWVDQSRDKDLAYPVTADDDGAQLVLRLFDDTHAMIAESEPHTLAVTTGGTDPQPITDLTIEGLDIGYHAGETATLKAVQNPATDEDHYHWFIKRSGDADFSVISGAGTATLSHEVAEADAGAQIVAKLYDHDHALIAESAPVTLKLLPGDPKPSAAPPAQTEDALDGVDEGGIAASTTTPKAGQVITVQVGAGTEHAGKWVAAWLFSDPVLLGGDWLQVSAQGTIAVTIPAGTTTKAHSLAVFDANGELIGWQELQVRAASNDNGNGPGSGPGPDTIATTGGEIDGIVLGTAGMLLVAGATLFLARRRRGTDGIVSE